MADGAPLSFHCRCAECLRHTTLDHTANLPTSGRRFTEDEWTRHRQAIRPKDFRAILAGDRSSRSPRVPTTHFPSSGRFGAHIQQQPDLPEPQPLYLPSSSRPSASRTIQQPPTPAPECRPAVKKVSGLKRPRSASPRTRWQHPEDEGMVVESSDVLRLTERIEHYIKLIVPPRDLLDPSKPVYFSRRLLRGGAMLPEEPTSELLKLDPDMPSNTPFIIYLHQLNRVEDFVARHRRHSDSSVQIQLGILAATISRYRNECTGRLTREWKRQRLLLHELRFVDTSMTLVLGPCFFN